MHPSPVTRHPSPPSGRVLIIAGSDSGGGAGIQGDLKTVQALGGYGMTAITALTAQNTQGVFGIHPVPEEFIAQQIQLCLSDIGADAIKTGMLHSASVIETVVRTLTHLENERQTDVLGAALSQREREGPACGRVRAKHAQNFRSAKKHITLASAPILKNAHELRANQTDAEKKLWQRLRDRQLGTKFRRQHPMSHYIADFISLDAYLVIELDGGQHGGDEALAYDAARTAFMERQGFYVLRFWNHEVLQNMDGVLRVIQETLAQASPHPGPLPQGEGAPASPTREIIAADQDYFPADGLGDPLSLREREGPGDAGRVRAKHALNSPQAKQPIPLIVDPVMVAKGGSPLLEAEALDALKTLLIPKATLITPNLPEAELLLGHPIATGDSDATAMTRAAEELLKLGSEAVLLKGGHGTGDVLTDVLVTRHASLVTFSTPRIATRHTHGTGCALASAIATGLAQKMTLEDAVRRAHAYVQQAIANAPGFGQGNGPLGH